MNQQPDTNTSTTTIASAAEGFRTCDSMFDGVIPKLELDRDRIFSSQLSTPMSRIIKSQHTPYVTQQQLKQVREQQNKDSQELRDAYLSVFAEQSRMRQEEEQADELWWRRRFIEMSSEVMDSINQTLTPSSRVIPDDFQLAVTSTPQNQFADGSVQTEIAGEHHINTYTYDLAADQTLLVGRQASCDIQFPDVSNVSRLACIVYVMKRLKKILVVDLGGLFGIEQVHREHPVTAVDQVGATPLNDVSQQRCFTYEIDELVILSLGSRRLVFNNKTCQICMEKPRQIVYRECKHYVCCRECAMRCARCPNCMQNVDLREVARQPNEYIGQTFAGRKGN